MPGWKIFFPSGNSAMHTRCMFDFASQKELPVVLLIDDDLVSREVTATLLTMSGYSVHTAESGETAVQMLADQKFRPGVILMDAQMPGLSGAALITELRTQSNAPVYAISGSELPKDVSAVVDGFLLKPFDVDALTKLIEGSKPPVLASPLDPNEPVLNAEILAQFRKLMPEPAVRQIYTAVIDDLTRRIDALGTAIAKGDATEVRRIGHAIKGGCGMAGAVQAAHLGALLEATPLGAKDNQLDNSANLLRDLRAATRGLERMLDAELPA
jgi:CheY-like chemotaxis protein